VRAGGRGGEALSRGKRSDVLLQVIHSMRGVVAHTVHTAHTMVGPA